MNSIPRPIPNSNMPFTPLSPQSAQPAAKTGFVPITPTAPAPAPAKLGQGAAGEFAGNAVRAVVAPLVRTGSAIESGLDETAGRVINAAQGKGFVPTTSGAKSSQAASDIEKGASGTTAGQIGTGVGVIAPYLAGTGEEETAAKVAEFLPALAEHLGMDANSFVPKVAGYIAKRVPTAVKNTAIGTAQTGDLGQGALAGVGGELLNGATEAAGAGLKAVTNPAAAALKKAQSAATGGSKALATSIRDVMPLENKATRIDALRNTYPDSAAGKGGVAREGVFGKSSTQYNPEDIERGSVAHTYINGVKDPVAKIGAVNQGISDVSDKVDNFLDKNAAPANFADMRSYMETNKPSATLRKDPGASESYERATQDALDTLYTTMKKTANETGDFGANTSGSDIRNARIAIDQQITKELGENTFGTPQYRGIKAAEIDTRNLLNRMSEDMLRYPGQMEQLNKLNDFVSSAKGRGIDIDMSNPEVKQGLEKTFGLNPTGEASAQKLANAHKVMSHLYDARDNMIDKYQSSLGKTKLEESIDKNAALKTVYEVGKKAIPFGIGAHIATSVSNP